MFTPYQNEWRCVTNIYLIQVFTKTIPTPTQRREHHCHQHDQGYLVETDKPARYIRRLISRSKKRTTLTMTKQGPQSTD